MNTNRHLLVPTPRLLAGLLLTLTLPFASLTVSGANGVWTNTLGGDWGTPANWSGGIIATNVDGVADFSTLALDGNAPPTVTINGVRTIGHLIFGDTGATTNWTLSTGTNVLVVSSGKPTITVNNQTVTNSASLEGDQGFEKLGAGTLLLNAPIRLTNGITVRGGTLAVRGAGALGAGGGPTINPITLTNAALRANAGATYTNDLVFAGASNALSVLAGSVGFVGSISGGGTVVLTSPSTTSIVQRGPMTNFNGTLILNAVGNGTFFMAQNDDVATGSGSGFSGSSNAVFEYNGGSRALLYNGAIPATCYMGELRGSNNAQIFSKFGRPGDVTLEVGHLGTSSAFNGSLRNIDQGATPLPTKLLLRKVGTGTLTLSGVSSYTGATDIRAGTLAISGTLGNTPVTVQNNAVFQVEGSIGSSTVAVLSGARLMVGSAAYLGAAALAIDGLLDVTALGTSYTDSFYWQSLSGSGVVTGAVVLSSTTLNPGPVAAAGTLTITNGSFTAFGGTLAFDLSDVPASGNDLLDVNGNLDFSTPGVTVAINKTAGALGAGTYVLAKCSGTLSGSAANLTLSGANPLDTLQFSGKQLQLVVAPVPTRIWTGDGSANLWDIGASMNWLNGAIPATYTEGDLVVFNTLGGTNPIVNIPATVLPSSVTVAGSSNYTFTGAGDIAGATSLVKNGTGTLTIRNTNTFSGTIFVSAGTLRIGDGVTNGSTAANFNNNAALVFANAADQALANVISGPGSLTKQAAGTLFLTATNTLSGPTTISAGTLSLGDGSSANGSLGSGLVTNNATLAINQGAAFTMTNGIVNNGGLVNLSAYPVTLGGSISGTGALSNNTTATLFLSAGNSYSGGTFINQGTVTLNNFSGLGTGAVIIDDVGGGVLNWFVTPGTTNVLARAIKLPAATTQQFFTTFNGAPLVPGVIRLTGVISGGAAGSITRLVDNKDGNNTPGINAVRIILENAGNTFTTIPEVFRGALAFNSDGALGNATNGIYVNVAQNIGIPGPFDSSLFKGLGLLFNANNITLNSNRVIQLVGNENIDVQAFTGTIAGPVTGVGLTKLGTGTLRLTGSGSLTGQTSISNGTLRVDGPWSGSNLLATAGSTLMGTGVISAPITIQSSATLSPGASLGTLTVGGNPLTLESGSTTLMELNAASGTSDKVTGIGTLTYGGTLTVTNTAGALAGGQSFQLFSASGYVGNFATTNLPALSGGSAWSWNPANGTLSVGVASSPTNLTAVVSGGNLNLSWPASHLGWLAQSNAVSVVATNSWFDIPGSASGTSLSVPINPALPQVYYRLRHP